MYALNIKINIFFYKLDQSILKTIKDYIIKVLYTNNLRPLSYLLNKNTINLIMFNQSISLKLAITLPFHKGNT